MGNPRAHSPNVKHKWEDSAIGVRNVSATGIAPSADLVVEPPARGVIVDTAGDLIIDDLSGNKSTIPLPAGQFSICITKIHAASTAGGVTLLF
jgi:hypothetical protein